MLLPVAPPPPPLGATPFREAQSHLDALVPRLKTIRKLGKSKGGGTNGRAPTQLVSRGAEADILELLQMIVAECKKQRFTLRQIRSTLRNPPFPI